MPFNNMREVSGQMSRFGGHVRAGRLFRSGQPTARDDVPPPGVRLIADLRHPAERRQAGAWPSVAGRRIISHDVDHAESSPHEVVKALAPRTVELADGYYQGLYRELPFDDAYRPLFGQILRTLAEEDGGILIHCTQGKDRTGILMALILEILGVDRVDIMTDFARSGTTKDLGPKGPAILAKFCRDYGYDAPMEVLIRLMCVQPSYLEAAYDAIEQQHGSVMHYLDAIGVDGAIRDRLCGALLTA